MNYHLFTENKSIPYIYSSSYVVGGSRGGVSFFSKKAFKLQEKIKVSTNRITSATDAPGNGKFKIFLIFGTNSKLYFKIELKVMAC